MIGAFPNWMLWVICIIGGILALFRLIPLILQKKSQGGGIFGSGGDPGYEGETIGGFRGGR